MLYWAVVFFVLALAAGVLGFFGIPSSPAAIPKILLVGFLAVAALSFLFGWRRRVV